MNCKLTQLARELGLQTIATNDFHYLTQEDAMAQDIMLCIGTNATDYSGKALQIPKRPVLHEDRGRNAPGAKRLPRGVRQHGSAR